MGYKHQHFVPWRFSFIPNIDIIISNHTTISIDHSRVRQWYSTLSHGSVSNSSAAIQLYYYMHDKMVNLEGQDLGICLFYACF